MVKIYDLGTDVETGILYIVMEYMNGGTLKELIRERGRLPFNEFLPILQKIAKGLKFIHSNNVLHRDLKPSNIMFHYDEPIIMDFGIAKSVEGTIIIETDKVIASFAYMAPERIDGQPGDERSDIYSFAVVAYEALSGFNPFDADTASAIIKKTSTLTPGDLSTKILDVPSEFSAILNVMLSKSLTERTSSLDKIIEFVQDTEELKPSIEEKPKPTIEPQTWENVEDVFTLTGHSYGVRSVAFSPDGTKLASGSEDDTIKIWSVSDGREIRTLGWHSSAVLSVAFSPDGSKLASGSEDKTIKIWSVSDGRIILTLCGHSSYVLSVAFSPDGTKLVSRNYGNTIKIWSVSDGRIIRTLREHSSIDESVAFSPDGTKLASSSWDNTIKIWSVSDGREIRTLRGHLSGVNSVAFSPDGTKLASGSEDETIKIWLVSDGREIRTLRGHLSGVNSVAFSPDGTNLAAGAWNEIKIWLVSDGREISTLRGHSDSVLSVAFSPDGTKLASGSLDDTIKIWQVK